MGREDSGGADQFLKSQHHARRLTPLRTLDTSDGEPKILAAAVQGSVALCSVACSIIRV
jgi:hypothetical protein